MIRGFEPDVVMLDDPSTGETVAVIDDLSEQWNRHVDDLVPDPDVAHAVEADDKAWFDKLPRRERRRLFRKYGLAKGARRKGGGPR